MEQSDQRTALRFWYVRSVLKDSYESEYLLGVSYHIVTDFITDYRCILYLHVCAYANRFI
jgi:hypothetical protein